MRLFLLSCCCLISGCSLGGNEPLEAQLRLREDRIRDLQAQLTEAEQVVAVARQEAGTLRSQLDNPDSVPRQEQLAAGFAVENLEIHELLTGITEEGEVHAVVRPIDKDGDLIKLPGSLELRLMNLSAANGDQQLGTWNFSDTEARDLWSSAAIGAGYVLDLPVESIPSGATLMLHARFVPADGRQFDASHSMKFDGVMQAGFETSD